MILSIWEVTHPSGRGPPFAKVPPAKLLQHFARMLIIRQRSSGRLMKPGIQFVRSKSESPVSKHWTLGVLARIVRTFGEGSGKYACSPHAPYSPIMFEAATHMDLACRECSPWLFVLSMLPRLFSARTY